MDTVATRHEWLTYFPYADNVRFHELRISRAGRYMITRPEHAALITSTIVDTARLLGLGEAAGLTIVDGTACVGGNTLDFARHFAHTVAVERDGDHCEALRNNLEVYGYNIGDDPGAKVQVVHGDYMRVLRDLPADCVMLDPPWCESAGVWYTRRREVQLYLSDTPLHGVVDAIFTHTATRLVALKVPYNFSVSNFARKVGADLLLRLTRVHTYFLLIVCKPQTEQQPPVRELVTRSRSAVFSPPPSSQSATGAEH